MSGGCVAAGSPLTVQAGLLAFEAGGNAVDAAVAAKLMACVAEPLLTGLGGAGISTVKIGGDLHVVDFFTAMPGRGHSGAVPAMETVTLDFGPTTQDFHVGAASVAVPGQPFGLWELHQRFGRIPFSILAEPAICACADGVPVTPGFEEVGGLLWPIQLLSPEARALFGQNGGDRPRAGQSFFNPDLGQTLRLFATEGPRAFRDGDLGTAILQALGDDTLLTRRDLLAYQVAVRPAHTTKRHGSRIGVPGLPSHGGLSVADAVELLDMRLPEPFTADHVRAMARAMDRATVPMGAGHTTHVSAVDERGDACAITSSLGETAGVVPPGTGLRVNNFLGEDDVNPRHRDFIPGERMVTMMTPTVLASEDAVWAFGSGGCSRIRSAVLHAIVHLLDHDLPPERAANGPRCHMEAGLLRVEVYDRAEPDFAEQFADDIRFDAPNMFFGGVHIAGRQRGSFEGSGDRRRSGEFGATGRKESGPEG
ncbi:MAG TPA: gamma-glutamyltransferase [Myxococcota bacterium]|nr:gamma-glutamyltransferase [Myxococcota bacterium]